MSIDVNATYRDGALYPETPLNLPENTAVRVSITAQSANQASTASTGAEKPERLTPPPSPRITVEEFDALVEKYSFSAPPLPENFSRADIYSDHD
jgi:hypothetical protein